MWSVREIVIIISSIIIVTNIIMCEMHYYLCDTF